MTIYTLKETLHDRIKMLEAGFDQTQRQPVTDESLEQEIALEARLGEAQVIFKLVDQLAHDQVTLAQEEKDHPVRIVPSMILVGDELQEEWQPPYKGYPTSDEDYDRHDPNRC